MRGEPWVSEPEPSLVPLVVGLLVVAFVGGYLMGGKRHHQQRQKGIAGQHVFVRIAMDAVGSVKNGKWDDLSLVWQTKILVAVVDAEPDGAKAMSDAAKDEYRSLLKVRQLTSSDDEDD